MFDVEYDAMTAAPPKGMHWFPLSCVPLKLDGAVDGFVGIGRDVTE